jgi:hypothetical protein
LNREGNVLVRLVGRILAAKRLPVPARQTGATPDADPPAPRLRQAGGLTADEIKLVEESSS